jgi:hypothetical protein
MKNQSYIFLFVVGEQSHKKAKLKKFGGSWEKKGLLLTTPICFPCLC